MLSGLRDCVESIAWRLLAKGAPPARRAVMGRHGLRPLREVWWIPLRYESAGALWRNVALLESSPEPARREAPSQIGDRARIAVYSPGHIGDLLQTVPLLRALRAARPRATITWIVGPWGAPIASRYAEVDRVDVFSPNWAQYRRGRPGPGIGAQCQWGRSVAPVDVFISTSNADLATLFVGRSLRPTWWCGRGPVCALYPVAPREDLVMMQRDAPEAEDVLRIAAPLGVKGDPALAYTVREEDRVAARALREAIGARAPYVVVAPGAGWPGKQWPIESWAPVCDAAAAMGLAVLLVGTPEERVLGARLRQLCRRPPSDAIGRTSIPVLGALVADAAAWLGSDSGGLHLAAALHTPTVALFGPTSPAKWAPRGSRHVALRAVEGCPDCHPWHPRARCAHRGACMRAISVNEVVAAMARVVAGPSVERKTPGTCGTGHPASACR